MGEASPEIIQGPLVKSTEQLLAELKAGIGQTALPNTPVMFGRDPAVLADLQLDTERARLEFADKWNAASAERYLSRQMMVGGEVSAHDARITPIGLAKARWANHTPEPLVRASAG